MTGVEEVALVAAIAGIAGTAVSAYSSYESGQAQKEAMQYQAAVARNNQIIADQNAAIEVAKGQRLEDAKRQETAQREGAVRAAAAASGLDVDSGSPLRLQEDTAMLGEFDAQTIRSNAARAAYGFKTEGMNYAARATMDDMAAENASRMGTLGAWSNIVGGVSSVADKWSRWKTVSGPKYGAPNYSSDVFYN